MLPLAAKRVLHELRQLGSVDPQIRQGTPKKAGPVVTDNGMWLIDAPFPPLALPGDAGVVGDGEGGIWAVDALADRLIKLPGVCEIGLFAGKNGTQVASGAQKPVAAYFGLANGGVEVRKP